MLKTTVLLLILPCSAARGVIDSKKAEQLVKSVYSQENQTRINELQKPRLNGTDEAMFLKLYHKDDAEEIDDAGMTAEKYSEVPFDAIVKMLKTPEEAPKVQKAKDAKAAADTAKHHHLGQHHLRHDEGMKPASHPAAPTAPKTFIDLGSGLGRTVLFASALGAFESCEGVELSESRHQMAVDALAKFKHLAPAAAKHVTFHQGNFLDNDAYFKKDAMLLDNSFLSDGVLQQVVRKFRTVSQRGSIMILTKKLNQLSDRAATIEHVAVEGKNGQRQILFKYTRT
jgi:hypothetical protein